MELKDYLQNFGFSKSEINFVLASTSIRDVDLIDERLCFYRDRFNLANRGVITFIKRYPELLNRATTSIEHKINFYQQLLDYDDRKIRIFIMRQPQVLGFDTESEEETSVKGKIKFYKKYFNLDKASTLEMIKILPALLAYDTISDSPTSVKSKVEFYKELFNINHEEVSKMIQKSPILLSFDTISNRKTAVKSKMKYLRQIASNEEIIKNPNLLKFPATKIKFRFLLLSTVYQRKRILSNNDLMTNEGKLWARKQHLEESGKQFKLMLASETKFVKYTGASTKGLMYSYPITVKTIEKLENDYFERTGTNLKLDKNERQAVLG